MSRKQQRDLPSVRDSRVRPARNCSEGTHEFVRAGILERTPPAKVSAREQGAISTAKLRGIFLHIFKHSKKMNRLERDGEN